MFIMDASTNAFEVALSSSGVYVGGINHQEDHCTYHMQTDWVSCKMIMGTAQTKDEVQ